MTNLLGVVVFGEPRPFFQYAADILAPYPNRSYLNKTPQGHDYVWDLPEHIEPFFPFVHGGECAKDPRGPVIVSGQPKPDDPWGIFRFHHTYLYRAGLLKLDQIATTIAPGQAEGLSDLDVLNYIDSLYQYPTSLKVAWDHYDAGADDGIVWAAKKLDGFWLIVNRGSVTEQDFERDIAAAVPVGTRDIGTVAMGFFMGALTQHQEVKALVGYDPVLFSGHSLGAARAQDQAALWVALGNAPAFVANPQTLGSPGRV